MKISVLITTLNEEKTIGQLLTALKRHIRKILVVDAGSTDGTVNILKAAKVNHLIKKGVSRAKGRNIAVKHSDGDILVMTDAGCIPHPKWLERIVKPFKDPKVGIVAGFYTMATRTAFQKAAATFLGVLPNDFNENFLPSTRSIAFRREAWKVLGGFPEELNDTAEDTVFCYKAVKKDIKIARVKSATVEWGIPDSLPEVLKKMYKYAKGDAQTKIFWNSAQGFSSHNFKVFLIYFRYLFGLWVLLLTLNQTSLFPFLLFFILIYVSWSFAKVFRKTKNVRAGLWGIVLQISSDLAVMSGFARGILSVFLRSF